MTVSHARVHHLTRTQIALSKVVLLTTLVWVTAAATGCAANSPVRTTGPGVDHVYSHAAVAADHPEASRAGAEMLQRGGNAVDAAVATSFTLSVVRPESCGIGGGGFMVIFQPATASSPARAAAINYREQCPDNVDSRYYVKLNDPDASMFGYHASGVPGTVAGLLYALDHFGTLDRATVLAPAIRAAEAGFTADDTYVASRIEAVRKAKAKGLGPLWDDGSGVNGPQVGERVRNPDQARALRLIAERGAAAFYSGEIAQAIDRIMLAHNGTLSLNALSHYEVQEKQPFRGRFQDYDIYTMPPPSSGGIALLQIFGMLESRFNDVRMHDRTSPAYVHMLTEMMKHAFADRAEWLADSDFVDVPIDRLLSENYLNERAATISTSWTMQPQQYGSSSTIPEDGGTSHLSVIDARGMAVACTETINLSYGSLVVVPGFGFCLNDQMDDFTTIPGQPNAFGLTQSDRNLPEPGKRPLSSMSPTIAVQGGKPVIVAGASGGPRIISGTLQSMLNVMLWEMNAGDAVSAPRFHHQWMPDLLRFEPAWAINEQLRPTRNAMRAFGHTVGVVDEDGNVQLISVEGSVIHAASDARKGGEPAGH